MPGKGSHQRAKTHCPHGHPYDEQNTRLFTNTSGGIGRVCKTCANLGSIAAYRDRIAAGICVDCGAEVVLGRKRCSVHIEKERLKAVAKRLRDPGCSKRVQDAMRLRRLASGQCQNCKAPASPGMTQCEYHRKAARDRTTRHTYRLSCEELTALREATHCALCGGAFAGVRHQPLAPAIDHNHKTGAIRNVIHRKCNVAIGMFNEDVGLMEKAIAYLKKHK